jgi:YVTN family beta-propeller protein
VSTELASGTVTFLFTDIEGSTRMLRELGRNVYGRRLSAHRALIEAAVDLNDGRVVDTQGDAFFCVFHDASGALAAAVQMQRALASDPELPRVRIGLHTGGATLQDGRYLGVAVHRAQRICSAGHGGQILLSNATREIVEDDLPPGVAIRDLGEHELKDLQRPARLFQADIDGLTLEFPPPRTAAADPAAGPAASRRRRLVFTRAALRSRRRLLVIAALVAVAGVVAVVVGLTRQSSGPIVVKANSIVRIDPQTNKVVQSIPVGRHPSALVATSDAVWVANNRDRTLSRVDVETGDVKTIGGIPGVGLLARDERGNIYASGWDYPFVWRIDPKRVEVVQRYRVRSRAVGLVVGGGSLWVVDRLVNSVTRIDLARGTVEGSVRVGRDPLVATFGFGALWVANADDATVSVIRPGVDEVDTVHVRERPFGIAAGEGGVWVGSNQWATITRIDPDTRRVVEHIDVGAIPRGLYGVSVGAGYVWAADWYQGSVIRLDPRTNKASTIQLPVSPREVAIADGKVWVSVVRPGEE